MNRNLRTASLASVLAMLLVAPQIAAAPPVPQDGFLEKLTKIAPYPPEPAKYLCVCRYAQEYTPGPEVGELRPAPGLSNGVESYTLSCVIPVFDTNTGLVQSTRLCNGLLFDVLPNK